MLEYHGFRLKVANIINKVADILLFNIEFPPIKCGYFNFDSCISKVHLYNATYKFKVISYNFLFL